MADRLTRPTYQVAAMLGWTPPRGRPQLAARLASLPMAQVVAHVEIRLVGQPTTPPGQVRERRPRFNGPNQTRTHCVWGHQFTAANTRLERSGRYTVRRCRRCEKTRRLTRSTGHSQEANPT
jgi:hypothetical protein